MCAPDKIGSTQQQQQQEKDSVKDTGGDNIAVMSKKSTLETRKSLSLSYIAMSLAVGAFLSYSCVFFANHLPFLMFPGAASVLFLPAAFVYDAEVSFFDNTAWTYVTDYIVCVVMLALSWAIQPASPSTKVHAFRSRCMLVLYALSVLAGGLAHQFYFTLEDRSTMTFRFLWTVCVGTVTAAAGLMGSIATELAHHDKDHGASSIPVIPTWLWVGYGICSTVIASLGGLSLQRPACDIFLAGTTQFPCTFYLMGILTWGLPTYPLPRWVRLIGNVGFIVNAPLLPLYPVMVLYLGWSLPAVNTTLHLWLLAAWSMQGYTLRRVCLALEQVEGPPPRAVPVKKGE